GGARVLRGALLPARWAGRFNFPDPERPKFLEELRQALSKSDIKAIAAKFASSSSSPPGCDHLQLPSSSPTGSSQLNCESHSAGAAASKCDDISDPLMEEDWPRIAACRPRQPPTPRRLGRAQVILPLLERRRAGAIKRTVSVMTAAVSITPSSQPFGSTVASVSRHSHSRFLVLPRSRRRGPRHGTSRSTPPRSEMSSSSSTAAAGSPSLPPPPDSRVVVGCGGTAVDYLAKVAAFPKPDDKIRSTSSLVQGGGNAGNALTGAARLGLKPRIISKLANDAQGRTALAELEKDGIDISYIVVSQEGNSPFTYIIVDSQMNTRTCIHTPGYPGMVPDDLPHSSVLSALDGARLAYFDVRFHETALVVAREASRMKIPILIDAERRREGLDDLLNLASYVVCSEKFPQASKPLSNNSFQAGRFLYFRRLQLYGGDTCALDRFDPALVYRRRRTSRPLSLWLHETLDL
ncbi:hypothetical protein Taro_013780, partial [Colocasia esculenta]|nr:hypothetical protein [Colocasia esculenta]